MRRAAAPSARSAARAVHTLRAAVEQLQRDSQAQLELEQDTADTFAHVAAQVAALQKGFSALADATLDELERARREREKEREAEAAWREEQAVWRASVEAQQAELHRTLTGACHWQADAQGVLEGAAADSRAARETAERAEEEAAEARRAAEGAEGTAAEVRRLAEASQEAAAAARACADELERRETARERAAAASRSAIDAAVGALQTELASLRRESHDATSVLARDAAVLSNEMNAVKATTTVLHERTRPPATGVVQHMPMTPAGMGVAPVPPPLGEGITAEAAREAAAAAATAAARASTQALGRRVDMLASSHERHAASVEDIMQKLVADAAMLARTQRVHEAAIVGLKRIVAGRDGLGERARPRAARAAPARAQGRSAGPPRARAR